MTRQEFYAKKNLFLVYLKEEKQLMYNTQRSYDADLSQFIYYWDHFEATEQRSILFNEALQLFMSALLTLDASSIARKISCFNTFKRFLRHKYNSIIEIPFKRPHVTLDKPAVLPLDDIFRILDQAVEEGLPTQYPLRDKAIVALLYATGMRCSELIALELQAVTIATQSITIRGKHTRERTVFFGPQTLARIQAYIHYERPQAKNPREHLFLNYQNKPLTARSIQRICNMFMQCLESSHRITPAILRHSFATHLLANGATVDMVQELLGHKTRISTERYLPLCTKPATSS